MIKSLPTKLSIAQSKSNDLEYLNHESRKLTKKFYSHSDILPNKRRKILVLDLDETLVHSSKFPPHPKVECFECGNPQIRVFKRPGVDDFLLMCVSLFDTYIYTYGTIIYADPILDKLCPTIRQDHRLYRHKCSFIKGHIIKDLDRFNRPLTEVILIEDNCDAKTQHPNNTILVPAWHGSPFDRVLQDYLPAVLYRCAMVADVRPILSNIALSDFR